MIEVFYKYAPTVFAEKTRLEQQTPLHYAMRSGNIQKAKAILDVFGKPKEKISYETLFNALDYNGMRAIDLLTFRQDTEYKK